MYKYLTEVNFEKNSLEYKNILVKLGKNIKHHRIEQDYSLTDVSVMTDISTSYLSKLENGKAPKPSVYTFLKICIAIKMEPRLLFNKVNLFLL
ncbi:MAG: helix-turn-helix transcriptional regulator [Lactococcus chungangensis]|uniref:Helix-turn-helix transcriptional regulator n=1 Tax=Pseudolactococcus chungangensis TaxID=451457 RepID=A0A847J4Y1_9LACT|nr:helix-turn-helix transcriptional regulator [Lactococcus chungangensis]